MQHTNTGNMAAPFSNLLAGRYTKPIKILITVGYFAALFYLVFFAKRRRGQSVRYLHVVPLRDTIRDFLKINYGVTKEIFEFYSNLLGNIFLFIPFSIITICVFNVHNKKRVLMLSVLFSFCIELLQYIFRVGVADIDDILLNTLGAVIGIAMYNFFKNTIAPYLAK